MWYPFTDKALGTEATTGVYDPFILSTLSVYTVNYDTPYWKKILISSGDLSIWGIFARNTL
jgi:hypothetical protein